MGEPTAVEEGAGEGVSSADENKGDGTGEYRGDPSVEGGGGDGASAEKAGTINVIS